MNYVAHDYQRFATEHVIDNPASGLFLDMGLGKTVSTLTAVDRLMFDLLEVTCVLVIAPKRVAENTWSNEKDKWDHLNHLRMSLVLGTAKQRIAALLKKADVYVINRENVVWLVSHLAGAWPFDMVVIDELSSFKAATSARFKALRTVRPRMTRVVGLTGTPAPNGLLDLWSQLYLIDRGERLGTTFTGYRSRYFTHNEYQPHSKYEVLKETDPLIGEDYYEKKIYGKIEDICISMKKEDWLTLPPRIDQVDPIYLSADLRRQYDEFERDSVLALEDADVEHLTAVNAAALTGKLLQFANGAVYYMDDNVKKYYEVHNAKIEALGEAIEAANGNPMLIAYSFKSDVERIGKHLKEFKPKMLNTKQDMIDWNAGKIPVALGHPASLGHGLNLQDGGNLMYWFGQTWSLELYLQFVARLDRQGQTKSVINKRAVALGTMDEQVIASLDAKFRGQEALLDAVKAVIRKYREVR